MIVTSPPPSWATMAVGATPTKRARLAAMTKPWRHPPPNLDPVISFLPYDALSARRHRSADCLTVSRRTGATSLSYLARLIPHRCQDRGVPPAADRAGGLRVCVTLLRPTSTSGRRAGG